MSLFDTEGGIFLVKCSNGLAVFKKQDPVYLILASGTILTL